MFALLHSVLILATLVGLMSSLFLFLISFCAGQFANQHSLIWLLPLYGLFTVWLYRKIGSQTKNTIQIVRQLHVEDFNTPFLAAPLIVIMTSLSQFFGASTGREGAAVQFGATIANSIFNKISNKLKSVHLSREEYLRMGIAAGFGSVFGLPLAGAVFANEINRPKKYKLKSLILCLLCSYLTYLFCLVVKAPHTQFPKVLPFDINGQVFWATISLGFVLGLTGLFFNLSYHYLERKMRQQNPYLIVLGGTLFILVCSVFILHDYKYNGLGLNLISMSFVDQVSPTDVVLKTIYTLVCVTIGLRGGEFVPLMSIGAMSGAIITNIFSLNQSPLASVGLLSIIAGTMGAPLTASLACFELFGFKSAFLCLLSSLIASRLVGKQNLYAGEL